jgi:hypothetical protein
MATRKNSNSQQSPEFSEPRPSQNPPSSSADEEKKLDCGDLDSEARELIEQIRDKYIRDNDEAQWQKTFPDEFYEELYELKGWSHTGRPLHSRPSIVGKYTNDIVYERLAPGILKELQQKNPIDENGNRPVRHFQWLTKDTGLPHLRRHLEGVIALMRAAKDWRHFQELISRSYPKAGEQLKLYLSSCSPG